MKLIKLWRNNPYTLSIHETEVCLEINTPDAGRKADEFPLANFIQNKIPKPYNSFITPTLKKKFLSLLTQNGSAQIQEENVKLKLDPSWVSVGQQGSGRFSGDVGASFTLQEYLNGHFQDWVLETFGQETLDESIGLCQNMQQERMGLLHSLKQ